MARRAGDVRNERLRQRENVVVLGWKAVNTLDASRDALNWEKYSRVT